MEDLHRQAHIATDYRPRGVMDMGAKRERGGGGNPTANL